MKDGEVLFCYKIQIFELAFQLSRITEQIVDVMLGFIVLNKLKLGRDLEYDFGVVQNDLLHTLY